MHHWKWRVAKMKRDSSLCFYYLFHLETAGLGELYMFHFASAFQGSE